MVRRDASGVGEDPDRSTLRRAGAVGSATVLAGGSAFGVLAALAGPSGAATFTVTEATDDGTGTVANTLSWAIAQANANPDADVIDFAPGLSTITFTGSAEQVPMTETVSITGPGSDALDIDLDGNCGLLFDSDTASLTVSGLTLSNGYSYDSSYSCDNRENGGALAIYSANEEGSGTFLFDDVVFDANDAYYFGGGLFVEGGTSVTIQDSAFTNNVAGDDAGGGASIERAGALDVLRTTFTGNTADEEGGGLEVDIASSGTARIVDSTFTDNEAQRGGAAYFETGFIEVVNSTLSGNSATVLGGGLAGDVPVKVIQSTITGNTAPKGGGVFAKQGGFFGGDYASIDIIMSTVSGNTASGSGNELFIERINNSPQSASIVGSIVAGSASGTAVYSYGDYGSNPVEDFPINVANSLIGTSAGGQYVSYSDPPTPVDVPWVDDGGNTFDVTDPGLEALADNGGPTQTMALTSGSPAIDAGPDPVPSFPENSYDQRGEPFARVYGDGVDIGALESQPEPEPTTTTTTPEPTTTSTSPAPTSSVPDPTTPTTSGGGSESASGGLPATGASVAPLVAAGAALVASGGAASLLAVRRRRGDGPSVDELTDDAG